MVDKYTRYVLKNPEGFYFRGNGGWVKELIDAAWYQSRETAQNQIKYWVLDNNCVIKEIKIQTRESE